MSEVECPNEDCDREYHRSVHAMYIACPCGVTFHQETGEPLTKKKPSLSQKVKAAILGK